MICRKQQELILYKPLRDGSEKLASLLSESETKFKNFVLLQLGFYLTSIKTKERRKLRHRKIIVYRVISEW